MANTIIGTIQWIGATQTLSTKSGNNFTKRDLVLAVRRFDPNTGEPITDNDNTPLFTFTGERCRELDNYQQGQMVVVSFDLLGRKYTDAQGQTKLFNDVRGYKIEPYGRAVMQVQQQYAQPQSAQQPLMAEQPNRFPVNPQSDSFPF